MSASTVAGTGTVTVNGLVKAPVGPVKKGTVIDALTPGGAGLWMCEAVTWAMLRPLVLIVTVSWVPVGSSSSVATAVAALPVGGTSWLPVSEAKNDVDVDVQATV